MNTVGLRIIREFYTPDVELTLTEHAYDQARFFEVEQYNVTRHRLERFNQTYNEQEAHAVYDLFLSELT